MKHFLILSFVIISFGANAQKFRQEIQDYNSVVNLRNETLAPKKNDKAFIQTTKHLYSYDLGNTTSPDDGLKYIVQTLGSYRWVCLNCHLRVELSQDSILLQYDANDILVQRDTIRLLKGADKFHSNIVGTAPYDPLNPLTGWVAPTSPIADNTVEVKFTDGTVGNYTFDGSVWGLDFVDDWFEKRICLNTATPPFTPVDPNNPTIAEVEVWKNANLSLLDQQNGTILTYYDPTPVYTIQPTLTINNQNLGASTYDYRVTSCIINGTEFATTPIDIVLANVYVYNNSLSTAIRNYFTANNIIGNVDDGSFTSYMDLIFYGVQGTTLNVSMTVEYSLVSTPTTFVTSTKTGVSNAVIAPQLYSCEEPLITYVLSDGDLITRTSSPSGIFYKEQSVVDAGTDKYAKVYRYGSIGIGMNKPKAPLHIYGIGDHLEPNLSDASIYLGGHGKKIYWGDNTKTPESGSNVHNLSLGEWNGDSDAMAYHAKTGHRFYVKAIGWDDNSSSQYPTFFIRNVLGYGSNVGKIGLNTNNPRVSVDFGNLTNPDNIVVNKDGMILPGGTTAERPTTLVAGTIRFNSETTKFEGYTGSVWVDLH